MPDLIMTVDTALAEVPVNIMPLLDSTDFVTREVAVAFNAAGMDLVWNFVTTGAAYTQTAVTPTSGGAYDWAHQGDGMYSIEIPASGGATINNDTEGYGWFTGLADGVLPWRGPVIQFSPANVVNALVNGSDALQVHTNEITNDLITAAVIADNAIDAGAIAANAITDAKVAADVTIASVTGAVGSVTGNVGGNVVGSVGSVVGAVGSVTGNVGGNVVGSVASVVGNVGGNVVGSVASLTTNNDKTGYRLSATGVDDVWDEVLEGSFTGRQFMRGFAAALLGELSGAGTTTIEIRDASDTKVRITATVDASGNRSVVVLDLT